MTNEERYARLIEENDRLKEEVAFYRNKVVQISKSVSSVLEKAKDLEKSAIARYELEVIKLRAFQKKWIAYYREIESMLPENENKGIVDAMLKQMDEVLADAYVAKEDPLPPVARVKIPPAFRKREKVQAPVNKSVVYRRMAPNESGFDLNEAINPKEDLETLCKELGLYQERKK